MRVFLTDPVHCSRLSKFAAVAFLTMFLSACSSRSKPEMQYSPRVVAPNQPVPVGGGRYKLGSPYVIKGVRYVPRNDPNYNRVGKASWYGDQFHGRLTANGEVFDANRISAAHKTLPLPSFVRITNLDNGRSIVARVNDRGPFVTGRIIDVSRAGARKLGFLRQGTARVRVTYVGAAPL